MGTFPCTLDKHFNLKQIKIRIKIKIEIDDEIYVLLLLSWCDSFFVILTFIIHGVRACLEVEKLNVYSHFRSQQTFYDCRINEILFCSEGSIASLPPIDRTHDDDDDDDNSSIKISQNPLFCLLYMNSYNQPRPWAIIRES